MQHLSIKDTVFLPNSNVMFLLIHSRFVSLLPPLSLPAAVCQRICVSEVSFALLRYQHMWYQTDLHGCDKANSPRSLPDRLIWANSQIAPQIESTLGCGRPSLIKIWISDQQRYQNNAWATCQCKQLGSKTDIQIAPTVAPVWLSEYWCAWRSRNVLLWYGCRVGKCVLAPCRAYIQG